MRSLSGEVLAAEGCGANVERHPPALASAPGPEPQTHPLRRRLAAAGPHRPLGSLRAHPRPGHGGDRDRGDPARRELIEETGWSPGKVDVLLVGPTSSGMSNERIAFVRARDLTRVGAGGGVDSEDITVHAVPRAEAPAWLMRKQAEGFELDLKLWAGLWMIDRNPDGSPAD